MGSTAPRRAPQPSRASLPHRPHNGAAHRGPAAGYASSDRAPSPSRPPPQINVYPMEHEKAVAAVTVCHTKQPKEGVPSRKERRKTMYTPRAQQRGEQAAAMAAVVAAPKP